MPELLLLLLVSLLVIVVIIIIAQKTGLKEWGSFERRST